MYEDCVLPNGWAERVAKKLKDLKSTVGSTLWEVFESLQKLEICEWCVPNQMCGHGYDGCEDMIRVMLQVRPHSIVVNNLLADLIYPLRRLMRDYMDTDDALVGGDIYEVKRTIERLLDMKSVQKIMERSGRLSANYPGPATEREAIEEQFGT